MLHLGKWRDASDSATGLQGHMSADLTREQSRIRWPEEQRANNVDGAKGTAMG